MFVWAEWSLGLFDDSNKDFFHHLVSPYTNGLKSKREFPLGRSTIETFVCERRQTDRKVHKHTLPHTHTHTHTHSHTHTQSLPKLLCVGETGLGDRFGELVSMLWVIW